VGGPVPHPTYLRCFVFRDGFILIDIDVHTITTTVFTFLTWYPLRATFTDRAIYLPSPSDSPVSNPGDSAFVCCCSVLPIHDTFLTFLRWWWYDIHFTFLPIVVVNYRLVRRCISSGTTMRVPSPFTHSLLRPLLIIPITGRPPPDLGDLFTLLFMNIDSRPVLLLILTIGFTHLAIQRFLPPLPRDLLFAVPFRLKIANWVFWCVHPMLPPRVGGVMTRFITLPHFFFIFAFTVTDYCLFHSF